MEAQEGKETEAEASVFPAKGIEYDYSVVTGYCPGLSGSQPPWPNL